MQVSSLEAEMMSAASHIKGAHAANQTRIAGSSRDRWRMSVRIGPAVLVRQRAAPLD